MHKQKIISLLEGHIPLAGPNLHFKNAFELLIAVILSAQCTDKQVNKTTTRLFAKYKTPQDFASLSNEQLAEEIKECGLYRNKSRHIIKTASKLVKNYNGKIPDSLLELQSLPGVGRKTANVVLNLAFGKPTFPVDTHIYRISRRLGLSNGNTPRQVERDLVSIIPEIERGVWHHRLIEFGRTTCIARSPRCSSCIVQDYCQYHKNKTKPTGEEN